MKWGVVVNLTFVLIWATLTCMQQSSYYSCLDYEDDNNLIPYNSLRKEVFFTKIFGPKLWNTEMEY